MDNSTYSASLLKERLKELRGTMSQAAFVEPIGIDRTTYVSYEKGKHYPDAEILGRIAQSYAVSADYLLGLTETKSPDSSVRGVCDLTGLSEKTVKALIKDKTDRESDKAPFTLAFINSFLEKGRRSDNLLLAEHAINQIAVIKQFEQEEDFHGILRFSSDELTSLYRQMALESLRKLIESCLDECIQYCVDELEKEAIQQKKGIRLDGDFQDRAYRKMIEESDEREEKDNG